MFNNGQMYMKIKQLTESQTFRTDKTVQDLLGDG